MTHYRKFIVTHSWGRNNEFRNGNAFIIPNHYSNSLAAYSNLMEEARKDFPNLKAEDVECLTVRESGWCKGMPVIQFSVEPDSRKNGWLNCEDHLPDAKLA